MSCKDVFKEDIKTVSTETLAVLRRKIKDKKLYYGCDAANKGGYHHMVKKLAWCDSKTKELECIVLDSDVCDGTDSDTVNALDFSFRKLDPIDGPKIQFFGQGTDAGGGGTSTGLGREMINLHRLAPDEKCFINTCSIHAHNVCIKSPAEKYLGSGSISNRNCLQLVFTAYALQNEFEPREFRLLWNKVNTCPYGTLIEAPVLTRWDHISLSFRKFLQ